MHTLESVNLGVLGASHEPATHSECGREKVRHHLGLDDEPDRGSPHSTQRRIDAEEFADRVRDRDAQKVDDDLEGSKAEPNDEKVFEEVAHERIGRERACDEEEGN